MNQRERFEAWAESQGWSVKRFKEHGVRARSYQRVTTRLAWQAWQQAEWQMIERCAGVCDTEAFGYANFADGCNTGMYDWKADAALDCAAEIRALNEQQASETEEDK